MPFSFPTIKVSVNMRGIANRLQAMTGSAFQPSDYYEVINTARDPSGQAYWKAVNDGTGIKYVRSAGEILGSSNRNKSNRSLGRKQLMRFWAGGTLISQRVAGPNKPVHMLERVTGTTTERVQGGTVKHESPLRNYWIYLVSKTARAMLGGRTRRSGGGSVVTPPGYNPVSNDFDNNFPYDQYYWKKIMESTMEQACKLLADITPIIKDEYYSKYYTTEPGTLKNSYQWRPISGAGLPTIQIGNRGRGPITPEVLPSTSHALGGKSNGQEVPPPSSHGLGGKSKRKFGMMRSRRIGKKWWNR